MAKKNTKKEQQNGNYDLGMLFVVGLICLGFGLIIGYAIAAVSINPSSQSNNTNLSTSTTLPSNTSTSTTLPSNTSTSTTINTNPNTERLEEGDIVEISFKVFAENGSKLHETPQPVTQPLNRLPPQLKEKMIGMKVGQTTTASMAGANGEQLTYEITLKNIQEPQKVKLTVISDQRCDDCNPEQVIQSLKSQFSKLSVKRLNYSSQEGKDLYNLLEIQYLPAYIFDSSVEDSAFYSQIQQALQKKQDYYVIDSKATGSKFDPTAEICDNQKDDTGNDLVDCEDPDCEGKLVCREEIPQKLNLFVMSYCPYGTQAENTMKKILKNFPNLNFSIYFIASKSTGTETGFNSLHGQKEVRENMRQVCAMEYYSQDEYMDYIWCRNKDLSANWQSCAEEANLEIQKIEECVSGEEGKKLLEENIKLAKSLGIGASPTWLVNNQYKFQGVSASIVQTQICSHNEGMKGCNQTIEDDGNTVTGGCGG